MALIVQLVINAGIMVFKTTGILITSVDQLNLKNMNNISYIMLLR